ncbi:hypothetical protein [Aneurinibacillus migulanus]|nr:hypothetical protein [Aneurinibacillus migulanus]MED0894925.1 hypothetical protein [Aneurinibacillus migulanus]MED1614432.1 hypothetical protein [Aneurinibacillus migulanus]
MQVTEHEHIEQMDIFQLEPSQPQEVASQDKLYSVGYYDYKDCFFRITVPAPDMETAKQKVLRQEVRHPKSYGCLRTWRIKEIK